MLLLSCNVRGVDAVPNSTPAPGCSGSIATVHIPDTGNVLVLGKETQAAEWVETIFSIRALQAARLIFKEEGLLGFYKGNGANVRYR